MDVMRNAFGFSICGELIFGNGAVEKVGKVAKRLGGGTVLIITDETMVQVGHLDKAGASLKSSGVKYEVGAMETVMEGPLDDLLAIAKEAHLACFQAGAEKVVTLIKIGDQISGTSIESKVGKYRQTRVDEGNHAS